MFQTWNLQLMTFPKRYFALKSINKWLKYHQKNVEKHANLEKNHGFLTNFLFDFIELYCVFQHSFHDISTICWWISMQNSVLERSLVVEYMTKIRMWNFKNFMVKLGSEIEICWNSGICDHVFLNNFEIPNIFLWQLPFLKA